MSRRSAEQGSSDAIAKLAGTAQPAWLRIAGWAVSFYMPLLIAVGYVYDWDYIVDGDPMFLSVLVAVTVGLWLALDVLHDTPDALARLQQRDVLGRRDRDSDAVTPLTDWCTSATDRLTRGRRVIAAFLGFAGMWTLMWVDAVGNLDSWNPFWATSMAEEYGWPTTVVIMGWVFVGAVVGVLALHTAVVVRVFHRIAHCHTLEVLVGHPDGASGLRPLGDQLLKGMIIGALPAAFASTWSILLAADDLGPTMQGLSDRWLLVFRWALVPLFALLIIPVMWPIVLVRRRMRDRNRQMEVRADELALEINDRAIAAVTTADASELEEQRKALAGLRDLHQTLFPLPTWPFRRAGVVRFVAALAPPLLSLSGLGDAVVRVISGALGSV